MFPFGKIISGIPWANARPITMGTSSVPETLLTTGHAIDIYTTSADTAATVNAFQLKSTTTGTQSEDQTMYIHAYTDIYSGNENTVGHFYSEWGTTSGIGPLGMASAVTGKMLLPTACTGAFYAFYGKMNLPTAPGLQAAGVGGNAAGWFMLSIGGETAGKTEFSNNGVFMDIHNLTAGAGKLLSLTSQTLKSVIDVSTVRYLVMSQMEDGLGLGNSTTDMALGTSITQRGIQVYTSSTSTDTDDSIRPIYMRHTVLGVGGVGHRAEFHTRCDTVLGTWCNALKGYWEWDNAAGTGTSGRTTGLSSAICAELKMPDAAVGTGHYYPLEVEFVGQTNSGPGVHHGFITMRASGTLTNFDDYGFLFDIQGVSPAVNHMIDDAMTEDTSPAINATMRIQVGTTTWYIPLSDTKDCS